jgi:flagellin
MPISVTTNIAALRSLTQLQRTNRNLTETYGRIASGTRIAQAADDAAGLGVAENLNVQSRGLRQAMRNINDGISVIEVSEGATNEVANIVKRLRDLAVQSASGSLQDTERAYIQTEADELVAEISRIAAQTNYNGVTLGDGTTTGLLLQVGANGTTNDQITIGVSDLTASTLGISGLDLASATAAFAAISTLDVAMDTLNSYRATLGAGQSRLESALRISENYYETFVGAESRIRDADFAYETAEMSRYSILQNAGMAVLAQANQINQGALGLIG